MRSLNSRPERADGDQPAASWAEGGFGFAQRFQLMVCLEQVQFEDGKAAGLTTSQGLALRANISWTFVGNLVSAACTWGTLIAMAKLGSPQVLGQFAIGQAASAPIMTFLMLGLREVLATDRRRTYAFVDYLGLRVIGICLALIAISLIAAFGGYRSSTAWIIVSCGLIAGIEAGSDIIHGLLQHRERLDLVSIAIMLRGILSLPFLVAAMAATRSLEGGLSAILLVRVLVLLAYEVPIALRVVYGPADKHGRPMSWHKLWPHWTPRPMLSLAGLSLPLGIVMLLLSLQVNLPRYFLERHVGDSELGIFAAISSLMTIGMTVVGAVGQSASPKLAECYAQGESQNFSKLLLRLLLGVFLVGVSGVLLAVVCGRPLLRWLFTPEYAEHLPLLLVLMAAATARYVSGILGYAATASRRIRWQVAIHCVAVAITLIACWTLLPFGLLGMGWAVLLSSLATTLGFSLLLRTKSDDNGNPAAVSATIKRGKESWIL